MTNLAPFAKAILGFVAPGAVIIGGAVTAASDGGSHITTAEWVTALVACVLTGGLVFGVPNKDPQATHQDESVQPSEGF
jgi:hypothetical protein